MIIITIHVYIYIYIWVCVMLCVYVYTYIYTYIYIYIYIYILFGRRGPNSAATGPSREATSHLRPAASTAPISELRLRNLRFAEPEFLGNSPWTWEFHPLRFRICLSQTLWNPDSSFVDWLYGHRPWTLNAEPRALGPKPQPTFVCP